MKFMIVTLLTLAVASAGFIPHSGHIEHEVIPGIAAENLVQGPSTKTRVFGPDGSQIASDAPGGSVVAEESPVVIPIATPIIAKTIVAEPVLKLAAPLIHQAPVVVAPVLGETLVASPVDASGYPLLAAGSELEGQYVPDNNEKRYDDGSYKEEGEQQ